MNSLLLSLHWHFEDRVDAIILPNFKKEKVVTLNDILGPGSAEQYEFSTMSRRLWYRNNCQSKAAAHVS